MIGNFYFGPTAKVAFGVDRLEKLADDVTALVGRRAHRSC